MESASQRIAYYLEQFRNGDGSAFHRLIEMDNSIIPELVSVFRSESDPSVREFIVEVIWQHRDSSVIPFLSESLQDPDSSVWKQAIDGLVTLASPAAIAELRDAKKRSFDSKRDAEAFQKWVDEAIQQIAAKL